MYVIHFNLVREISLPVAHWHLVSRLVPPWVEYFGNRRRCRVPLVNGRISEV